MTTNPIPQPSDELVLKVSAKLREALDVCIDDGDGAIDVDGIAKVAIAAMPELSALQEKVEEIWREGWTAGYRAGVIDGGSDSCWSDENGDWEKFKARTALTDTVGGV